MINLSCLWNSYNKVYKSVSDGWKDALLKPSFVICADSPLVFFIANLYIPSSYSYLGSTMNYSSEITYLLKANNRKTSKRWKIYSQLTINAIVSGSDDFIVNFEHVSYMFLVFLLLILNTFFFLSGRIKDTLMKFFETF